MLKIIGICSILIGTTGCGYSIVTERKRFADELKDWITILEIMEGEISFKKSTLQEICLRISQSGGISKDKKDLLYQISEEMLQNTGESFYSIWKERINDFCKNARYSKKMNKILSDLGEKLYFENPSMQMNIIADSKIQVERYLEEETTEQKKQNKVTLYVGAMTGVLLTILLF